MKTSTARIEPTRADRFLAAVHARGSDARDVRDAAHEACHAIQWDVTRKWTRTNIDRAKPKDGRVYQVADEITARAVEQMVCADLGVECDSIESCALTMILECAQLDGLSLPCDGTIAKGIRNCMKTPKARELADRVMELAR